MMNKTKPQRIDPKQVKQFLADAHKKASTARKNLPIDAEAAYQIAYEAMLKASLALMLSHGERPRVQLGHSQRSTSPPRLPESLRNLTGCVANGTMPSTI